MKTFLSICLLIGLANSALLGSNELKSKPDWDDEDSMILPSTSSPPSSILPEKNVDENNVIQTQPKFISLIPKGTYEEPHYEYLADQKQSEDTTSDYSSASGSVTPSTEEEEGSTSDSAPSTEESDKKELPRTHLMQLGKIPLKLKVIPLLPPVHDQLLGNQNEKYEDFNDRSKELVTDDPRLQKSGEKEEVSDDVVRVRTEQDHVPQAPLTYMVPPRVNEEDYWRKYPVEGEEQSETDKESQVTPVTTINPILERLNDFLQKAKRHYIEQQQLQQQERTQNVDNDSEEDVEEISAKEENKNLGGGPINFDSDEIMPGLQSSTTESVENPEAIAPPQQVEMADTYGQLVPPQITQRGAPGAINYQPEPRPLPAAFPYRPEPFRQTLSAPSMDQIIPEYYNYQNSPRPSISPSPYIYSPNAIPSTPIPKAPQYISPGESYWLRKYLYENLLNEARMTSPFARGYYNNEYYRPQRNSYFVPSAALLNSIQDYPSFPYGNVQTYGNFVPRRSAVDMNSLYYQYPNSYLTNQRSSYIPSLPYYYDSSTSRDMYAPLFPYQQYRTISPSPQSDFF